MVWGAVEPVVWTHPCALKGISRGDRAEPHGRRSRWGDSSPPDVPTAALAAAPVRGEHSGVRKVGVLRFCYRQVVQIA